MHISVWFYSYFCKLMQKTNFKGGNYPVWFVYFPDQFVFVGQYLKTNQIQASVPLLGVSRNVPLFHPYCTSFCVNSHKFPMCHLVLTLAQWAGRCRNDIHMHWQQMTKLMWQRKMHFNVVKHFSDQFINYMLTFNLYGQIQLI